MIIENREISLQNRCFIIAEAGVNHNGDADLAHRLIDEATRIGADAIKFQLYTTDDLVVPNAEKANYQKRTTNGIFSQHAMLKSLELTPEIHIDLMRHCQNNRIIYLCTPYDYKSLDFLIHAQVSAIKVASTDVTNIPFLKKIACSKVPTLLSTGMSSLSEVAEAYESLISHLSNKEIAILHCTSEYPSPIEDTNLRVIMSMRSTFPCEIGYSDHTNGIEIAPVAYALGASIIEKHFTLDKTFNGPDHQASLNPTEFKKMICSIRQVEKALGSQYKNITKSEEQNKERMQKSLVAAIDIPEGTLITEDMIIAKRPATGLPPKLIYRVIGRKTNKKINKNEQILFSQLC